MSPKTNMRWHSEDEVARVKAQLNPMLLARMEKKVEGQSDPPMSESDWVRFLAKIDINQSGCWIWRGCSSPRSYSMFSIKGKNYRATRLMYAATKGPIGDLFCCHTCDVPACVNPDHLFLGDQRANMWDAAVKGRLAPMPCKRGEEAPTAKLKASDIPVIRELLSQGLTCVEIGEQFGVSMSIIYFIKIRRTWKHIP